MSKKHPYVALAQVIPGAILAEDLLDKVGHVLLPAGTELTASILKAIGNHQIYQLPIKDLMLNDPAQATAPSPEICQQQIERLQRLFRHAPHDGPTEMLRQYVEKYRKGESS